MKTRLAAVAALCLCVWFSCGADARASELPASAVVSHGDLQPGAPEAGFVLRARLDTAAARVCGLDRHRHSLRLRQPARLCYLESMARAQAVARARGFEIEAPALRQQGSRGGERIEIAYGHLDLRDVGAREALAERVARAVRRVCRVNGARGLAVRRAQAECTRAARASADIQLASVLNPELTATSAWVAPAPVSQIH